MIKKIYFDLDCTLADFKKGIKEIGYDEKTQTDDEMWKMIKDTPHFYKHLKPIDGAVQMLNNLINKYGKEKIEILSGLPKEKRKIKTAKQDKIDWVKEFVSKDIIINLCTREEKKNYCKGKEYVLVDDLKENCEEWKENGGIAILCKSISKVDKEISKLINDDDISGLAYKKV